MTTCNDIDTYGSEWDWDKYDDSQYCEHGTFVGSNVGPDLMCLKCESGIPAVCEIHAQDWEVCRCLPEPEVCEIHNVTFANCDCCIDI